MVFAFVIGIAIAITFALWLRPAASSLYSSRKIADLQSLGVRYRPMLRLLDGADLSFLSEFGDARLIRRARSERRAIFRAYLRCLRRDHARICAQIRYVIVNSPSDRKDLAIALSRAETSFQWAMSLAYLRLALHGMGIGSVGAAQLTVRLEKLRLQALQLSSAALAGSPA